MRTRFIVAMFVSATLAVLGIGAAATSPSPSRSADMLAAVRHEIEAMEAQLAKVEALECQVAQLEQTIAIMTPMLADRGNALRTGDVNGDGKRDGSDQGVWFACKNVVTTQPVGACWFVDMNKDGRVDYDDLTLLNAAIKAK